MGQVTTGIRSLLDHPRVYHLLQTLLGAHKGRTEFVQNFIRPAAGNLILDIYKVLILPSATATEYVEIYPVDQQSQRTGIDTETDDLNRRRAGRRAGVGDCQTAIRAARKRTVNRYAIRAVQTNNRRSRAGNYSRTHPTRWRGRATPRSPRRPDTGRASPPAA